MPASSLLSFKLNQIVGNNGVSYLDFRKSLQPNYFSIWLQVLSSYLFLVFLCLLTIWFETSSPIISIGVTLFSAVGIGYTIAFVTLFVHEASHYGLASNKKLNDFLGTYAIGFLVGLDLPSYRRSHWQHHTKLGTTQDPERSYFDSLNLRSILQVLSLIVVVKRILWRISNRPLETGENRMDSKIPLVLGLFFHALCLGLFFSLGHWMTITAWVLGFGIFFPFFGWLRQLLEHRSMEAVSLIDYAKVNHGELSRIFVGGFFTKTFGGAGFDRHIIHHLDATVSCTNFAEVEKFLMDSNVRAEVESARTTYLKTFRELYNRN